MSLILIQNLCRIGSGVAQKGPLRRPSGVVMTLRFEISQLRWPNRLRKLTRVLAVQILWHYDRRLNAIVPEKLRWIGRGSVEKVNAEKRVVALSSHDCIQKWARLIGHLNRHSLDISCHIDYF
jgi:hypothetical protein